MKIVICGSINFTPQIKEVSDALEKMGYQTEIPKYSQKIISGEVKFEDFLQKKEQEGDMSFREADDEDLIIRYYNLIRDADAILAMNIDKKGIDNYIGGNTFLELGFAHVLGKKIYLYNPVPDMLYTDEIKAVNPIVINQDLSIIK